MALARALITRPRLLLLDEPFSSLDQALRRDFQENLKRLHRELGFTCIHVTHDLSEALGMADSIALLFQGKLKRSGRPEDFIQNPDPDFRNLYHTG